MPVNSLIDWLSVTIHGEQPDFAPSWFGTLVENRGGLRGYDQVQTYTSGVMVGRHSSRASMGTHIVASGSAIKRLKGGVYADELVNWLSGYTYKVSRLDIAIDIQNEGVSIDNWLDAVNDGKSTKHGRTKVTMLANEDRVCDTMYVGSLKNRTKLLRAYNKGVEMSLPDSVDWKRVEMSLYEGLGTSVLRNISTAHDKHVEIQKYINGFITIDEELWSKAMGEAANELPVRESSANKTEEWLLNAVAPAMARVLATNPMFGAEFANELQKHMDRINHAVQKLNDEATKGTG